MIEMPQKLSFRQKRPPSSFKIMGPHSFSLHFFLVANIGTRLVTRVGTSLIAIKQRGIWFFAVFPFLPISSFAHKAQFVLVWAKSTVKCQIHQTAEYFLYFSVLFYVLVPFNFFLFLSYLGFRSVFYIISWICKQKITLMFEKWCPFSRHTVLVKLWNLPALAFFQSANCVHS